MRGALSRLAAERTLKEGRPIEPAMVKTSEGKLMSNTFTSRAQSLSAPNPRKAIFSTLLAFAPVAFFLLLWQAVCALGFIPPFMLPSPLKVVQAFFKDLPLIAHHARYTLSEAFLGIAISVIISFVTACFMDTSAFFAKSIKPFLTVTQTIPTVAIAPIFVLWFGYGATSKVLLVVLTCFFPLTTNLAEGFGSVDQELVAIAKSFGAKGVKLFYYVKVPLSTPHFFAGLKIALSYAVITAVVAEWLGGNEGLGVYMIRVKKSYAFDKMFAVIAFTSLLTIALIKIVDTLRAHFENTT